VLLSTLFLSAMMMELSLGRVITIDPPTGMGFLVLKEIEYVEVPPVRAPEETFKGSLSVIEATIEVNLRVSCLSTVKPPS